MNKKLLISFLALPLALSACNSGPAPASSEKPSSQEPSSEKASSEPASSELPSSAQPSSAQPSSELPSSALPSSELPSSEFIPSSEALSSSEKAPSSEEPSSTPSQPGHTPEEVEDYMNELKKTSEADHFYYHYYRAAQTAADYNEWDVWAWPNAPKPGEGHRFDWVGRTQAADRMSATGDATIDNFGYAHIDIDLTATYKAGWNNVKKQMKDLDMDFYYYDKDGNRVGLDTRIGLQIVKSQTRVTSSGFWTNDGGNLFVDLADYALVNKDGSTSYHCFVAQDLIQDPAAIPPSENIDPFENDDGSNVTYGKTADVNFKQYAPKKATSKLFLQGDSTNASYMTNGAGVGYQIMVSSFADSDGDGNGDILGIINKLDYLKNLGVNVLWLTPIQLSDSYHGYDISDYTQVDPKFGSTQSTHVKNGVITPESAMLDYIDLINQAHAKGMGVIMDLVLNHTSTSNKWFIKSAQLNEDYRNYYQWGNHTVKSKDNPYGQSEYINQEKFWYPYGDHAYSYYAKFGSSMPEINYAYVSTRAAVATMAKQWCEIGVDGFRMDAVKHIFLEEEVKTDSGDKIIKDISTDYAGYEQDYSSNLTKNLHFWRQLASDVKSDYPNCFFVGENFDGHAYNVAPYYEGFDSLFDFYTYFNLTTLAAKTYGANVGTIYGGPASANAFFGSPSSNPGTDTEGNKWDLWHVYDKYKYYRGGSPIMGTFTSNHDIARTINRIAGTGKQGDEGLSAQGNVTTTNFNTLDKLATLVQITELMLPGCTWIYYGDEIGMTGNFPNTTYEVKMKNGSIVTRPYDKDAPYADLWYRQPMKWTASGKVGDGSMTTGYEVTGSGTTVGWDSINGSNTMKSVEQQLSTNGSHLKAIQTFAKIKSTNATLIRGSFEDKNWDNNYVVNLWRTLGSKTYAFVANYNTNKTISMGYGSTGWKTVATFNGATGTSMPSMSCILLEK